MMKSDGHWAAKPCRTTTARGLCEVYVDKACDMRPCVRGTCEQNENSTAIFRCRCPKNWVGPLCQGYFCCCCCPAASFVPGW